MPRGSRTICLAVIAALLATTGCSRQATIQAATESPAHLRQAPFEQGSLSGRSPTAWLAPSDLPAGTLITIRLLAPLSSATAVAGDPFEAALDAPIDIQGQLVAPAGATVSGKIVSAKPSASPDDPGYLRLTLTAISLDGRKLPMQSSSIFAKANISPPKKPGISLVGAGGHTGLGPAAQSPDVHIPADGRLTFRLTRALPLHSEASSIASK